MKNMERKKILILGATGTFGSALTKRLVDMGKYDLTLFARHASEKYGSSKHSTGVDGSALDYDVLLNSLKGQDVIYCAISGETLPDIAENLVRAMKQENINRLLFMGAVGIYNEIPDEIDGEDNLDNEPAQIPNRKAVDVIESSELNYTILRPGYLREGEKDDFVLTFKGEMAKGYISTIPSVVELAVKLIENDTLYVRQSVSITKDMHGVAEHKQEK